MTLEQRLKNLRVIEGRDCWLEAQLERYPQESPKWKEISAQLEADRKERDAVYRWIEAIPRPRTANIIILHYVKNQRWHEVADLIGISASGCKMNAIRYIQAAEKRADELQTAVMLDLLTERGVEQKPDAEQSGRIVKQTS